jgi:hypothetical protein
MIILNEGYNEANATCSRNKNLSGSVCYLFGFKHKLSQEVWRLVPFRIQPSVGYAPGYDLFSITIDPSQPEAFLTGATMTGQTNVHLIEGEYYVKVWEQSTALSGNTNPALAYDVVYETICQVNYSASTNPITYSGTSDIYKIYEG